MAAPSRSSCSSFALRQLEKHGWKHGHGLGKTETGISEAIKVKIKQDTAGIGHDPAEEFTYHWWDHVFNKAASNIVVENHKDGVTLSSKDKTKMTISNTKTPKGKKPLLYGSFVKSAATLTPDGLHQDDGEALTSSSSDEEDVGSDHANIDDKFFKACGGRTAHKGARHGLNLSGKLKRIQEQEEEQARSRRNDNTDLKQEDVSKDEGDCNGRKRRKKHKKDKKITLDEEISVKSRGSKTNVMSANCINGTNGVGHYDTEKPRKKSKVKKTSSEMTDLINCDLEVAESDRNFVVNGLDKRCKRKKKRKRRNECAIEDVAEDCKKNRIDIIENGNMECFENSTQLCDTPELSVKGADVKTKKSKKKKKKRLAKEQNN